MQLKHTQVCVLMYIFMNTYTYIFHYIYFCMLLFPNSDCIGVVVHYTSTVSALTSWGVSLEKTAWIQGAVGTYKNIYIIWN